MPESAGHAAGSETAEFTQRLGRAQARTAAAGLDALLVTPGPDLRYLTGYDAVALERLTCLVLPATGDAVVVVPGLEQPAALASPLGALGVATLPWAETDDPYELVAALLPQSSAVGLDSRMWADKVLRLRSAMPEVRQALGGVVLGELRMRKSAAEIESLRGAGTAIDAVHAQVPAMLAAGRTEREVGRDIADAILAAGHARVDFVIVASGPNGASPHHEVSDRVLQSGDAVVVDIGGTMPDGYCSDSTRTYALGNPGAQFTQAYAALQQAQAAAVAAVRPGVTAEQIDAAARDLLTDAGLGELFIHRTGHGIGLETHEDPYIVSGNSTPLEPGMAFSVEPGFYLDGSYGARIEDIVVCGQDGPNVLNQRPRELVQASG